MVPHWPDEVLHQIFSYLAYPTPELGELPVRYNYIPPGPIHLARICQASHQFRRIAEPLLYGSIWMSSLPLVKTLCHRPDLAAHVQYLECLSCQVDKDEGLELYNGTLRPYFKDNFRNEDLLEILDGQLEREDNFSNEWSQLVPLWLLVLARNVATVIVGGEVISSGIYKLFELCGDELDDSEAGTKEDSELGDDDGPEEETEIIEDRPPLPLSKLRVLDASTFSIHGEPELAREVNLGPLMFFPLLEVFKCSCIIPELAEEADIEDVDIDPDADFEADIVRSYLRPGWGSCPDMKCLVIRNGSIRDQGGLEDVLRTFPNLETLVMEYTYYESRREMDFTAWGDHLRKYGKNLRHFFWDLAGYDDLDFLEREDIGVLGSLRSLTNLTKLRARLPRLIADSVTDLSEILPQGLQWFWAEKTVCQDKEAHDRIMEKLLLEAESKLPDLEWVCTTQPQNHNQNVALLQYWEIVEVGNERKNGPVIYIRKQVRSSALDVVSSPAEYFTIWQTLGAE